MPELPAGISVPRTLYWLFGCPAPLAGMNPQGVPWADLYELGVRYVVCLTDDRPDYHPEPPKVLHAVELKGLVRGGEPKNPSKERERIRSAVDAIVPALQAGEDQALRCIDAAQPKPAAAVHLALARFDQFAAESRNALDRPDTSARARRTEPQDDL